jgi:hypothetical protein
MNRNRLKYAAVVQDGPVSTVTKITPGLLNLPYARSIK